MKKQILLASLLLFGFASMAQTSTVKLESSNLPIFIINTKGKTIADDPKVVVNLRVIYNGPGQLNRVTDKNFHYNNAIGIELRGNSSQSYPQQQYGFETRDSVSGDNLDFSLLGLPADNDWVLYAPYNDVSMLRNVLTYRLWNQMEHWGPRTKFCEVILNGDYRGVYILTESIKRGDHRVDAAKLTETDTAGRNLTGGYILKIDKKNNTNDKGFVSKIKSTSNSDINWLFHYPKSKDILPVQEAYIHRYIDTVEAAIHASNFADPVHGYAKYLSTQSFIDYLIITEFTNNVDGYKSSSFFYKEKQAADGTKGKLKAGPVWDYNLALGNVNFCQGGSYNVWQYGGCNPTTMAMPKMWKRLLEDPAFANAVKCRYLALRKDLMSEASINRFLDSYALDTLAQAQARHFSRWKILGTNPGYFNAYVVQTYSQELQTLKTWISNRLKWIDANLGGVCTVTDLKNPSFIGNESITVYPNPFEGSFTVRSSSPIQTIQLYDAQGRLLSSQEGFQQSEIVLQEMGALSPGLYGVKCHTVAGTHVKWMHKKN